MPKPRIQHETAEPGVHILQSRRAAFRNIVSPVPAVVWVLTGTKRLSTDRHARDVQSGRFVLLPENVPMTVENVPHAAAPYEARVLAFGRDIFELAYKRVAATEDQRRAAFQSVPASPDLKAAFGRARAALSGETPVPASTLAVRCEELVLWLAEEGAFLPWPSEASFADRVRAQVATRPDHAWTSAEVGTSLGFSEATLRRRLREEGTSFREVLRELRLLVALSYLQTTNWRVGAVARAVGYSTPSRFSRRFEERFGIPPADLRVPRKSTDTRPPLTPAGLKE